MRNLRASGLARAHLSYQASPHPPQPAKKTIYAERPAEVAACCNPCQAYDFCEDPPARWQPCPWESTQAQSNVRIAPPPIATPRAASAQRPRALSSNHVHALAAPSVMRPTHTLQGSSPAEARLRVLGTPRVGVFISSAVTTNVFRGSSTPDHYTPISVGRIVTIRAGNVTHVAGYRPSRLCRLGSNVAVGSRPKSFRVN